jgi:hypothetical protein
MFRKIFLTNINWKQPGLLFITVMMEAVRTSETSVHSETTRRYIPEDSFLTTTFVIGLAYCVVQALLQVRCPSGVPSKCPNDLLFLKSIPNRKGPEGAIRKSRRTIGCVTEFVVEWSTLLRILDVPDHIWARRPTILTEGFRGFPQSPSQMLR